MAKTFSYDLTLSFAGEDRQIVKQFAEAVKAKGVTVFYDEYEQANLWGRDLYQHLAELYQNKARYCLVFVSEAYSRKLWTRHELRNAQARAFTESAEYILPVRLDDTALPGMPSTMGYIDMRTTSDSELVNLTPTKLGKAEVDLGVQTPKPQTPAFRLPRIPRNDANPSHTLSELHRFIEMNLEQRFACLAESGIRMEKSGDSGLDVTYRLKQGQRLLYFLRFRKTTFSSSEVLGFLSGWNEPSMLDGFTGYASVEASLDSSHPKVKVINFSLLETLPSTKELSFDRFVEAIWEKACKIIESLVRRR